MGIAIRVPTNCRTRVICRLLVANKCHTTQASLYMRGIHAEKLAEGESSSPCCWDCHGGHDILPPTSRESKTYPLNIVAVLLLLVGVTLITLIIWAGVSGLGR